MRNQNKARAVMVRAVTSAAAAGGHRSAEAWANRACMVAMWAEKVFPESVFAQEMARAYESAADSAAEAWADSHGWQESF